MRAPTGWLLLATLAALALFAAACSSGDDRDGATPTPTEDPTATPTATPSDDGTAADPAATPAVITDDDSDDADAGGDSDPPSYASPPPVSASVDGSTVALGLGSYCWTQPGGPGLCADSIGWITQVEPFEVAQGDAITLASDLDLANASSLQVQVFAAGTAVGSGSDWTAWHPEGETIQLDFVRGPQGLLLRTDLDPRRYVIGVFVRVPQGDAAYGLLLEVGAAHPDASGGGIALGERVELAPGASVAIAGGEATLTFVAVTQDSRCPSDAVCVWAGEAELAFRLEASGEVHTGSLAVPPAGAVSVALGPYLLSVLELQPETTTTGPIAPADYRAAVLLERLP